MQKVLVLVLVDQIMYDLGHRAIGLMLKKISYTHLK